MRKTCVTIIGVITCGVALLGVSASAWAQDAAKKPGLTVAGIMLGLEKTQVPKLIEAADMTLAELKRPGSGKTQIRTVLYENAQDQILALDYSDHPTAPRVTGIRFEIGDNIDLTTRMDKQIRAKYGAPIAVYRLGDSSDMHVWETVAPEQSRDFGPLVTISLTTGEDAKLTLSQFTRPQFTGRSGNARIQSPVPLKDRAPIKPQSLNRSDVN